ncbi:MAG: Uma2 family endonuclease [Planctomycetia bacterium]|nr:Uma2 family endonuclease [Planctomycetia bacterium]
MSIELLAEPITPDDLLAMPNGDDFELVDGELVERHMGAESSWIASNLIVLIAVFYRGRVPGHLFTTDCGYQCYSDDPGKVRKPDVSFVRKGRFPKDRIPKGYIRIPPDLAVEVLSPNDLADEVEEKVEEYLDAGVRLVWVISPKAETVTVYRADRTAAKLHEADGLSGESVLPGFLCQVSDLFVAADDEANVE